MQEAADQQQKELERIEKAQIFASRIMKLASEEVARRGSLESRWLQDLQQYEGQYDTKTQAELRKDPTRSQVFVNLTRRQVNAAEARVIDMLFPTDDKNWGIQPTPSPELSKVQQQAHAMQDEQTANEVSAVLEEAEKRAEAMEREIDDQLTEADYNGKARDCVHEAALYGTGVLKAPVIIGRTKKVWHEVEDESGQKVSVLEIVEDRAPTVQHVSIWNYFPDSSATKLEDCAYELERHYMTKRQLADLMKLKGFFKGEVKALLAEGTGNHSPDNGRMSQMRAISGLESTKFLENRYEVWEYHGTVTREELETLGVELDEEDSGMEFDAIVFVCNNRVLKATINPLETGEHPYSVVCWQKDEASIYGKGIPYLMRDSQAAANAAWRTMMENMGLSSGDQIVVDTKAIEPFDKSWRLAPRKLWKKKDVNIPISQAFATFPIQSHQAELANIIEMATRMGDEETNMPRLMVGESPGASAETMGGMAMQMNAANVVLRRMIKNFDDHITRPLIRRFYDFNMQFSDKEEIKGDMSVKARGSSALLVKEQQAQSLMQLMQLAGQPGFAELTDTPSLYKKVIQAMHLEPEDVLKSDDEIEQMKQAAEQNPPQDPAMIKVQADMQLAQMKMQNEQQLLQMKLQAEQEKEQMRLQMQQQEAQMRMQEMQAEREITVMKLAMEQQLTVEQINAKLHEAQMKHQSDRDLQTREIASKQIFGTGL